MGSRAGGFDCVCGVISCGLSGHGCIVNNITVTVMIVCTVHLFALRVVDRSCGGGTSSGTFLGRVRFPSHNTVCSEGNGLVICGSPSCSVVIIVGRRRKHLSAVSFYGSLNVAGRTFRGQVRAVGSEGGGPKCSQCARRLFVDRLSSGSFDIFRRGVFEFPNFCIRGQDIERCICPCTTRMLKSINRISPDSVRRSSCCRPNSCVNGLKLRGRCRGRLQNAGNIGVVLHSTHKEVRKDCRGKGLSRQPITNGSLALNVSIGLRTLNRELLRNGVKDVITVSPESKSILTVISSPSCSPHQLINGGEKGVRG